jgi:glycosyltransferase involved in cell wall biosynthesis
MSYTYPVPAEEKARARRTLNLVDGIVHDGCFIEKWLEVAPDVVPNQGLFPEADAMPAAPAPNPHTAVFVGRLDADSGIQIYVDAIRVLRDRYGVHQALDIYGDGTLRSALQAQAQRESLPISFHGWRADAQERIVDGCFAFVAGRMAMQEAMARRRLVVAAYTDPLKRDYVNGEPFSPYLVSAGDAESIAGHVQKYALDHAARVRRVDEAFEYARTLSWTKTAREYLALWEAAPRRHLRTMSQMQRAGLAWRLRSEARRPKLVTA